MLSDGAPPLPPTPAPVVLPLDAPVAEEVGTQGTTITATAELFDPRLSNQNGCDPAGCTAALTRVRKYQGFAACAMFYNNSGTEMRRVFLSAQGGDVFRGSYPRRSAEISLEGFRAHRIEALRC